jgi:hypothetical protein
MWDATHLSKSAARSKLELDGGFGRPLSDRTTPFNNATFRMYVFEASVDASSRVTVIRSFRGSVVATTSTPENQHTTQHTTQHA